MSPPMVSLSKKEPLKPTFDEELPAKKTGYDEPPSVITVDLDRRLRSLRQQKKQGRRKVVVGVITLLVILAVAAVVTYTLVRVLRKHRSSWKVAGSAGLTTDVTVDDDKKLINAQHKQDKEDQGHVVVMEILHEYSSHMVAYRDVSNSTCYIDRLDETFEVGYQRWESYEADGRKPKTLKVIGLKPIEVEVLRHIGDIHIYAHCESGDSYWVMEIEETEVTTAMRVVYA